MILNFSFIVILFKNSATRNFDLWIAGGFKAIGNDMEWLLLCVWVMFDESFYHLSFYYYILFYFFSISAGVSLYFFISSSILSYIYSFFFLKQVENCEIYFFICTLCCPPFYFGFFFYFFVMDPIATEINISRNVSNKDETHIHIFFMEW